MKTVIASVALLAGSASAFNMGAPLLSKAAVASRSASRVSPTMKIGEYAKTLVGSDLELPNFDPLSLSLNKDETTVNWFRSAELKHGRVAMLAALGQLTQSFFTLPDPVFSESNKPWDAMLKVTAERPLATMQIVIAVAALEWWASERQERSGVPGDLLWDPLNLKPTDPEIYEQVQKRELKNGRLAMLAIAGMMYQEHVSGQGVIEMYRTGSVSPFNDGIGYF